MVEVNPATHALDRFAPLGLIAHHDGSAFRVVLGDAHFKDIFFALDTQLLVNFVLNRQTMTVPAKATVHVMTGRVGEASHDILHCSCKKVTIMGQARSKRRSIVEGEGLAVLGLF